MIIYQLISPSNKSYIGKTSQPLEKRWNQHLRFKDGGFAIHSSLRKYGPEYFVVQELSKAATEEQLTNLEKVWIILLQSANPEYGYNLTWGGDGGSHNDASKAKISKAQKGVPNKPHSAETRQKMSKSHMGMRFTDTHKRKISLNQRGERNIFHKLTERQIQAIRSEYVPGVISQRKVGEKYGISQAHVSEIISGNTWSHL